MKISKKVGIIILISTAFFKTECSQKKESHNLAVLRDQADRYSEFLQVLAYLTQDPVPFPIQQHARDLSTSLQQEILRLLPETQTVRLASHSIEPSKKDTNFSPLPHRRPVPVLSQQARHLLFLMNQPLCKDEATYRLPPHTGNNFVPLDRPPNISTPVTAAKKLSVPKLELDRLKP